MKKWFGILGVIMVLAGCQDSTSDVAVVRPGGTEAPPDSIITKDGVTVEVYRPGHPKTTSSDALWASSISDSDFGRLEEQGYVVDMSGPMMAVGRTADGRTAELTWFPANDPFGFETAVLHVLIDGEESVLTLDGRNRADGFRPETSDKGDNGPLGIEGGPCLDYARALYQACVSRCVMDGHNSILCRILCFIGAVFYFLYCVFTSL